MGNYEEIKTYSIRGQETGRVLFCRHCGKKKTTIKTNHPSGKTKKERAQNKYAPKDGGYGAISKPITGGDFGGMD